MAQTEIETTYLAASLPENLASYNHKKLMDVYFPAGAAHPSLRIRQKGDAYVLTKKRQVEANDASVQTEEDIELTREEFEALRAGNGKVVTKVRYEVPYDAYTAEVDVFTGELDGLVLVDIEFESKQERDAFRKPDFCGADVTQEEFIAGGMLAGKNLADIQGELDRLQYKSLRLS